MNTITETAVMESVDNNPWQNLDLYASDEWEKIADRLADAIYHDSGVQRNACDSEISRKVIPVIFPDGKMAIYISFRGEKEVPFLYFPEEVDPDTKLPDFETLPDIIQQTRMKVVCDIVVDGPDGTKRTLKTKYNGSYPNLGLPDIVPPPSPEKYRKERGYVKHVLKFQRDELLKAAKGERIE